MRFLPDQQQQLRRAFKVRNFLCALIFSAKSLLTYAIDFALTNNRVSGIPKAPKLSAQLQKLLTAQRTETRTKNNSTNLREQIQVLPDRLLPSLAVGVLLGVEIHVVVLVLAVGLIDVIDDNNNLLLLL